MPLLTLFSPLRQFWWLPVTPSVCLSRLVWGWSGGCLPRGGLWGVLTPYAGTTVSLHSSFCMVLLTQGVECHPLSLYSIPLHTLSICDARVNTLSSSRRPSSLALSPQASSLRCAVQYRCARDLPRASSSMGAREPVLACGAAAAAGRAHAGGGGGQGSREQILARINWMLDLACPVAAVAVGTTCAITTALVGC